MPIPFNCPHCGHQTLVADEYAGKSGPCSACGKEIVVPEFSPAAKSNSGAMIAVVLVATLVLGAIAVVGGVMLFLVPAGMTARTVAVRTQSMNNLRQIGLAFHNYHASHNTFPPAYIPNDDGSPRTSWRVLVLPYVNQSGLYNRHDPNENWDHPSNDAVRAALIPVYRSPILPPGATPVETQFFLITGPGTAFDKANSTSLAQMTDGTANIAIAIEIQGEGIEWSEPRDIDINEVSQKLTALGQMGVAQVNVLMADGSVRMMSTGGAAASLPTMATISDGK